MENSAYPCPGCGQPATLVLGCPACGRGPDPTAAEVIRLDGEIRELTGRVEAARQTYLGLAETLRTTQARRAELAARVRATRTVPVRPLPVPALPGAAGPGASAPVTVPGRPETSTRTVQGLLFVLGGLLLGTAAVVFTAVAWAAVGIAGRALILLAFTALALAAPLVAARRGLRGTAETFAAVGLLLVVLDGYAAWTVDLFGVTGWPGTRYAALAGGASAAVAAGYGRLSRLAVPWFAALLAAQPVLPLLAVEARPGAAGWAAVLTGVALVDLAVVALLRGSSPLVSAGRTTAWVGYAAALLVAAGCGVVALLVGKAAGTPLLAGAPLLLAALALLAGAAVAGGKVFRRIAAALLVVVVGAAAVRPVAELRPSVLLIGAALVAVVLALVVRLLPAALRPGPAIGALVVAGVLAQVALAVTAVLAVVAVSRSLPPWQGASPGPDLAWGWQVPAAVLLVTAVAVVLLPSVARRPVGLAGLAVLVLAVPAAWAAPWPVVVGVEIAAAVVLLLVAVWRDAARAAVPLVAATAGAVLAGHALLVALAGPAGMAAAVGALVPAGIVAAMLGRRHGAVQRMVAGLALGVALLATPAALTVLLFAVGVAPWWQLRVAAAVVGLLLVALVAVRRHWPDLRGYASAAVAVAVLVVGLAPAGVPAEEPVAVYAALAVLAVVVSRPDDVLRGAGVVLLLVVAAVVAPAGLGVLVAQYGWLGSVWSGTPDGVGLLPGVDRPGLAPGVALLVLTVVAVVVARIGRTRLLGLPATATSSGPAPAPAAPASTPAGPASTPASTSAGASAGVPGSDAGPAGRPAPAVAGTADDRTARGWRSALWAALPAAGVTLPVLLAGAGTPWPAVPAAALLFGLAGLLAAAFGAPGRAPVSASVGLLLAGSGLAGLLPTRSATLVGLGLTLVAAVTVGAAGRHPLARTAGLSAAAVTAPGLALTAALAGGLPLRTAAFAVLSVAVLALVAAAVLAGRRPAQARLLDHAAQGIALVALLLTAGAARHAAVVCTLWGAAVALRVLRPGEAPAGRRVFAAIAGASELLGAWLLLAASGVVLLEAYTLPAAVLALGAGLLALRRTPALNSWLALGPGLAAALLPSLVSVLVSADPQPWRRLLLGAGALGVVLVGAVRRWQAPVLLGGVSLAAVALHEVVRGWDLLPRWIYLAVGGFALIALASTYERRRRDLARLRATVARMS